MQAIENGLQANVESLIARLRPTPTDQEDVFDRRLLTICGREGRPTRRTPFRSQA